MPSIHRGARGDGGGFRQQIKRLAQGRGQLSTLPRAVRNNEIEQTTFLARFLLFEQPLRIPRQFEQPHPFFEVGLIGALVLFDLMQATVLLCTPLARHPFEKRPVHLSVELVHVHGMHAVLEPIVFGP